MSAEDTNVVVCGHVDHGKSTLVGRLASDLGQVSHAAWTKAESFIREFGSRTPANVYSALVARQSTEMEQGRTYVPSHVRLTIDERAFTLIDTPGSVEFTRGRIYGTFLADVGLLVVASNKGPERQTREALDLLRGLGVPLGGIVLTKSDLCGGGDELELVKQATLEVVVNSGVRTAGERVHWATVSALHQPALPAARALLTSLRSELRDGGGPLRFCVQGRQELIRLQGLGTVVVGVVESGRLAVGDEVLIEPASTRRRGDRVLSKVKSLHRARGRNEPESSSLPEARPRDIVSVLLSMPDRDVRELLDGGGVLSHPEAPVPVVSRLTAQITVLSKITGAHIGWRPHLLAHVMASPCQLVDVLKVRPAFKEWTGGWAPGRLVKESEEAEVVLELEKPMPFEMRAGVSRMARFTLREHHNVSALGVCTDLSGLSDGAGGR